MENREKLKTVCGLGIVAEKGGFEPPVPVNPVRLLSRKVLSATQPFLQYLLLYIVEST